MFDALWDGVEWREKASVSVDKEGIIQAVGKRSGGKTQKIGGIAVPGVVNAHSHAFQNAMAGLAESCPEDRSQDDFWTWRELMYRFALSATPTQIEAIAAACYRRMRRNGYTHVVEFHYLHHDERGASYRNRAELGERIMRAAEASRIGLTLLPVLYQTAGIRREALPEQRRFVSRTVEDYLTLLDATVTRARAYPNVNVGIALHSLRAVPTESIREIMSVFGDKLPVHIHAAEQPKEVEECLEKLGARPIEWILENMGGGPWLNVIHATHMTPSEIVGLAHSGSVAVICPTTEANLADGIFPLADFRTARGQIAIGSDSNICLDPAEEIRLLDYLQRLSSGRRNAAWTSGEAGEVLLNAIAQGGLVTSGRTGRDDGRAIAVGMRFDAAIIDSDSVALVHQKIEKSISGWIYSGNSDCLLGTISGGALLTRSAGQSIDARLDKSAKKAIRDLASATSS